MEVDSFVFYLDSKYASSGSNSQPLWAMDTPLVLKDPANFFRCRIVSAEIPFSFKTLTSPNNLIYYTLTVPEDSVNYSSYMTIPEGNYSITDLLLQLQVQMYAAMTSAGFAANKQPTLALSYSAVTGRCTLTFSVMPANHTFTMTLLWSQGDVLAEFFGFSYLTNTVLSYTAAQVITSTNYVSPNNVNVSVLTSLYIRSTNLHQTSNQQEQLVEQFLTNTDILCKMPIYGVYNSWLMFDNLNQRGVKLNNRSIENIQLYLTTNTFTATLLQGVHWRVCLEIVEYEPPFAARDRREAAQRAEQQQMLIDTMHAQRKELTDKLESTISKIKNGTMIPKPA